MRSKKECKLCLKTLKPLSSKVCSYVNQYFLISHDESFRRSCLKQKILNCFLQCFSRSNENDSLQNKSFGSKSHYRRHSPTNIFKTTLGSIERKIGNVEIEFTFDSPELRWYYGHSRWSFSLTDKFVL